MTQSPNNFLNYRPPDRGNNGCGMLFLQSLGGFVMAVICAIPLSSFGFFGVAAYGVGLIFTIVLAFKRRPGFLIGFLIASGMFFLLLTLCGPGSWSS